MAVSREPKSKPDNALAVMSTLAVGLMGTFVWFLFRIADIGVAASLEGIAAFWAGALCVAILLTRDGG